MRCRVLLFAQLAERAGSSSLELDLEPDATVEDAMRTLADSHDIISQHLDSIAVAVDEEFVSRDARLSDGQTIALIPPVSGG